MHLTPIVPLALAALAGLGVLYLAYRFSTLHQRNVHPLDPVFTAAQFPQVPEWLLHV